MRQPSLSLLKTFVCRTKWRIYRIKKYFFFAFQKNPRTLLSLSKNINKPENIGAQSKPSSVDRFSPSSLRIKTSTNIDYCSMKKFLILDKNMIYRISRIDIPLCESSFWIVLMHLRLNLIESAMTAISQSDNQIIKIIQIRIPTS